MKRYIAVIIILILVLIPKGAEFYSLASSYSDGEYCFYIDGDVDSALFTKVVKNGSDTIAYCSLIDVPSIIKEYRGKINGESFTLSGTKLTIGEIVTKLDARVVSTGEVGGIYTVYLYTGRVNTPSVDLFGDKVNIQIALSGDKITVGYPIILGSY